MFAADFAGVVAHGGSIDASACFGVEILAIDTVQVTFATLVVTPVFIGTVTLAISLIPYPSVLTARVPT